MTKFKNKYRIESNRLKGWDYGKEAFYFVTICCKNREPFFGYIENGEMNLSEIGKIVAMEWQKTFELRPDMNLTMGEYVVMPNHFHAIISIGENVYNTPPKCDDAQYPRRDAMHCVSTVTNTVTDTITNTANTNTTTPFKNKFGPQSKNLASIIRGFKSAVTINARKWQKTQPIVDVCTTFAWQPNYHDHIIRNEKSFQNISQYIVNNPIKWKEDTFHPKNHNTNK